MVLKWCSDFRTGRMCRRTCVWNRSFLHSRETRGTRCQEAGKRTTNHCRLNSYLGWIYVHRQKFAMNCQWPVAIPFASLIALANYIQQPPVHWQQWPNTNPSDRNPFWLFMIMQPGLWGAITAHYGNPYKSTSMNGWQRVLNTAQFIGPRKYLHHPNQLDLIWIVYLPPWLKANLLTLSVISWLVPLMFPLILHGSPQVLGCPLTILHSFPSILAVPRIFVAFPCFFTDVFVASCRHPMASTIHAMPLDRGAFVDHWNWPLSPGHQSCDRWSRRLWPSLALGHVGGFKGHPVQRFANATAMMVMNKNFKGRGAIGLEKVGEKLLGKVSLELCENWSGFARNCWRSTKKHRTRFAELILRAWGICRKILRFVTVGRRCWRLYDRRMTWQLQETTSGRYFHLLFQRSTLPWEWNTQGFTRILSVRSFHTRIVYFLRIKHWHR